ncbi:MAG: F0F1 ATP synthase subunit epsilon [Acidobacteria bacterium]|nr:F0F1 ATP synthase subunit epsilon [Acidobacteriota bacterium]MBK8148222.1 F0F1 ATP synthase subunit epsilon [Acidobacteriota bacterium]MBK8811759.1 F0F1 ATP synthase subunit epsilon [Acidobacteriota bacterium]
MLNLEIVTPEKKVLDATVDSVTIPTASGDVGIMTNHAPLISALRSGVLSYTKGGQSEKMVIAGGFVEISNNKVSILADFAETTDDIDAENAKQSLDAAGRALSGWQGTAEEYESHKDNLDRAQARAQLAAGK